MKSVKLGKILENAARLAGRQTSVMGVPDNWRALAAEVSPLRNKEHQMNEDFERPKLEPKGKAYRLAEDWHTDCKGILPEKMTIPAGFVTDGASIPWFLWAICGDPMEVPRIYAAIVHDYLYELGGTKSDRLRADEIYRDYNIALGMPKWRARIEYRALRMFGGSHWGAK